MKAACSSKMMTGFQQATWHYIPVDRTLQIELFCNFITRVNSNRHNSVTVLTINYQTHQFNPYHFWLVTKRLILAIITTILAEVFHGFPLSIQAEVGNNTSN
jgi:hypothetical protein